MEAATSAPRKLDGEKAGRIVAAMRQSVGVRGAAGSTFDVVAREAGVSRGLLHYYFGSKERLMVEVVRRDCDTFVAELEGSLEQATTIDQVIASLVQTLDAFVKGEPGTQAVIYEMLSASHHSDEIRAEMAELYRTWRHHLAAALERKQKEGVVTLRGEAEGVAALIFAIGDGLGLQMVSDPDWAQTMSLDVATGTTRYLLGA